MLWRGQCIRKRGRALRRESHATDELEHLGILERALVSLRLTIDGRLNAPP